MLDTLYMSLLLVPFAFFWCCCGPTCLRCTHQNPTINVTFTGFVDGSCDTCNNYNTTVYSLPVEGDESCGGSVTGGCVQGPSVASLITLSLQTGIVRVTVRDASAIPIGVFELAVDDPWDCRTTQMLPRVSGFTTECDTTGATCQIN